MEELVDYRAGALKRHVTILLPTRRVWMMRSVRKRIKGDGNSHGANAPGFWEYLGDYDYRWGNVCYLRQLQLENTNSTK